MYIVFIYENRRMKLVEIVLRRGEEGGGRQMEGVNLKIHCKYRWKCHNVSPPLLLYANLKKANKREQNTQNKQTNKNLKRQKQKQYFLCFGGGGKLPFLSSSFLFPCFKSLNWLGQ
jgi:hypothetical protein